VRGGGRRMVEILVVDELPFKVADEAALVALLRARRRRRRERRTGRRHLRVRVGSVVGRRLLVRVVSVRGVLYGNRHLVHGILLGILLVLVGFHRKELRLAEVGVVVLIVRVGGRTGAFLFQLEILEIRRESRIIVVLIRG
jgi:hypothetical protein